MKPRNVISAALFLALPLSALADDVIVNVNPDPYNLPPQAVSPAYPQPAPTPTEIDPANDPHQRGLSLGGPRFGASYVQGGGYEKLKEAVKKAKPDSQGEIEPFMTQFGWQMEYRIFRTSSGVTALTELIPLIGGMDQGLALPSATWLVGMRTRKGFELGVGPNVGLDGVSMMAGAGYTADLGGINVPLNVAVGRGASQTTSLSFSVGFNL